MKPTKENTLYLTIKQIYFDEIIKGTKKNEYREIKPSTVGRYLEVDKYKNPYYDTSLIGEDDPDLGDIYIYNKGVYPYFAKESIKYLALAVGYNKVRDTATVEVESITFEPMMKDGKPARFSVDKKDQVKLDDQGNLCVWTAVFHLGKVVDLHKPEK